MRALMWIVLAACGTKPAAPVGNADRGRGSAAQATAAKEDCTSRVEGWKPGNVDRFSYEDGGKHGFRDGKGRVVITAQYNHVYEFSPYGIAAVVDATHPFLFIDARGKVLAQAFAYDNGPDYFQEGVARIVDADKKVGFLGERGDIAIVPRFVAAASFCHGKAEVEIDGETYFIDKHGNKTTPPPLDKE
ncbi:MAG: WG repeat-containing protein [Kofleriaceae bacterium]